MQTPTQLEHWFGYHPATATTGPLHQELRAVFLATAQAVVQLTFPSPEQDEAIKSLRMAMYWANAAVAVNLAPLEEE